MELKVFRNSKYFANAFTSITIIFSEYSGGYMAQQLTHFRAAARTFKSMKALKIVFKSPWSSEDMGNYMEAIANEGSNLKQLIELIVDGSTSVQESTIPQDVPRFKNILASIRSLQAINYIRKTDYTINEKLYTQEPL